MGKNVIVCLDGTSNRFGKHSTNVLRLFDAIERNSQHQVAYYDPGVGTLPQPGLANPVKWLKWKVWNIADLMVGWGLETNVEEAYRFLMHVWEPGDRVFVFGFSRGAYTARVLAGLLHAVGLLRRNTNNLVPYLMAMYKSVDDEGTNKYFKLTASFRNLYCQPTGAGRLFPIHFLGVWDTVSSYGWIWNPTFPNTAKNPSIENFRHAASIDERRGFFRLNHISLKQPGDVKEYWFPGVHADVGGGYPEDDGGLWRPAFEWMIEEATEAGILINEDRLRRTRTRTALLPKEPALEPIHQSLSPWWWPAEFIPRINPVTKVPRVNLFRTRKIPKGAPIHQSALVRLQGDKYDPPNISTNFKKAVELLKPVPNSFPYDPNLLPTETP